ncbi:glycosyltransferase family 61 protein [Actibacterium sp. XHP0104]|uniref:glycosyltransferase family 61 protein n=1 Tax=Actibacterium sp. XHP0104 TaxID=2984335 RepID=UPI0021E977BF|nr:glycosyltransferase family 61 protein [Actibacterium sp. XHP0104]MCV2881873.1 glycosyltransferase family 61 protein [Actibacterium sp. XHP0104]
MITPPSAQIDIAPLHCPEARLITARSYLIDRFVPDSEIVLLPAKTVAGGRLGYHRGPVSASVAQPRRRSLMRMGQVPVQQVDDALLIDFRLNVPQNWAHFLNNHLPILFRICDDAGLSPADLCLILPGNTPGYIAKVAALFGLRILSTDDTVQGQGINFTSEPWTGIRPARRDWATLPWPTEALTRADILGGTDQGLPRKVFLSRQDTRTLENEAEVEALLAQRGFTKLYAEDLTPAQQFRLFQEAEEIVAIHGAGLAPLLYLAPDAPLKWLIELFPCGHMTDVYRVMAHQCGIRWMGVRGRIRPEHVAPAYELGQPFLAYSLQPFHADCHAIAQAIDMLEQETQ